MTAPSETVVCPVCELSQPPAWECAQCGARLAEPMDMEEAPEAMPGLELTRLDDPQADVAVQADPLIEHTAIADPRLPVTADALPGLERTLEDFGTRTEAPPAIPDACPYCGTVQPGVLLCDGCGRRKVKFAAARAPGKGEGEDRAVEGGTTRCPRCGARVKIAIACSDCGSPLKHLEEIF